MARTDSLYSSPDATIISLTNLVSRLEGNLLSSSEYQQQLVESDFQRDRVAANIEYGRTLLLQLEHSLPSVKTQSGRNALHADLAQKRQQITALKQCLDGLAVRSATEFIPADDDASSDNDILLHTPEDSTPGDSSPQSQSVHDASRRAAAHEAGSAMDNAVESVSTQHHQHYPSTAPMPTSAAPPDGPDLTTTTLHNRTRIRSTTSSAQPPQTAATTTATSHLTNTPSAPTPAPTSTDTTKTQAAESALSQSRAEQDTLTTSLLSLASQLKTSSQSFQSSLESEKSVVDRAVQGLDKNVTGMDAAGRRMGMLRRMTEGRGWWGRMLMYAWIIGLWLVAVFIVYLGPKLRF